MDLNLRQLRMLREVAARGTIAAAAESLGYTPSAVSQQLAGLERSIGVEVLERVGRNVRLTDAGRELVRHAQVVLDKLELAKAAIEQLGGTAAGTIELSMFESVAATIVPRLIRGLAATHPQIELRTRQMDPDQALTALATGDLDIAFILDYPHAPGAQPEGIERRTICHDWFRLVVPEDDPIVAGPVPLADLADRNFVSSPPHLSCGRCVVQACRDAGFEPRIHHQIDDYPTTLQLVACGAGVALVPDLGLIGAPPGIRVLDLTSPVVRHLMLGYRTTSADRPAVVAVRDAVTEVARGLELDMSGAAVG